MDYFCERNRMTEVELDVIKIARTRLYHLYKYIRNSYMYLKVKVKVKPSHYRPGQVLGFQKVEAPRFQDSRHMKVVRLSALRTGRLWSLGNIPGAHFC
jgi:hypothetical protein